MFVIFFRTPTRDNTKNKKKRMARSKWARALFHVERRDWFSRYTSLVSIAARESGTDDVIQVSNSYRVSFFQSSIHHSKEFFLIHHFFCIDNWWFLRYVYSYLINNGFICRYPLSALCYSHRSFSHYTSFLVLLIHILYVLDLPKKI